jgi:hypothetical protein
LPARRSAIDPKAVVQTQLATTGGLRIDSQPPGAHIVVDGDPSGRQTPALLDGLPAGRTLDVQLQKEVPDRHPAHRGDRGQARLHSFTLVEDWGLVRAGGAAGRGQGLCR